MVQTAEEKQAAKDEAEREAAQKQAATRLTELETQLDAAQKRADGADAKVAELEGKISAVEVGAPMPVGQRGTVTVNAKNEVVR